MSAIEFWNSHVNLTAQVDGTVKAGDPIKARILDVNKKDGVVDLSLRPLHTAAGSKKAAKALSLIEVHKPIHCCRSASFSNDAVQLAVRSSYPFTGSKKEVYYEKATSLLFPVMSFSRSCHGRCSSPVAPTYASKSIAP